MPLWWWPELGTSGWMLAQEALGMSENLKDEYARVGGIAVSAKFGSELIGLRREVPCRLCQPTMDGANEVAVLAMLSGEAGMPLEIDHRPGSPFEAGVELAAARITANEFEVAHADGAA